MSKLTDLEKIPLTKLCKDIKDLKKIYDENVDSFQDTVCYQYQITTDEQSTFDSFMLVVQKLNDVIENMDDNTDLIKNHFLQ